jgi:hypothetical protein
MTNRKPLVIADSGQPQQLQSADVLNVVGGLVAAMNFQLNGRITPPALSGDTDNWSPTGLATASVIEIDYGANGTRLLGLQAPSPAAGEFKLLFNVGSTNGVLAYNVSSAVGNRFEMGGLSDVFHEPNQIILLWYRPAATLRWFVINEPPSAEIIRAAGSSLPMFVWRNAAEAFDRFEIRLSGSNTLDYVRGDGVSGVPATIFARYNPSTSIFQTLSPTKLYDQNSRVYSLNNPAWGDSNGLPLYTTAPRRIDAARTVGRALDAQPIKLLTTKPYPVTGAQRWQPIFTGISGARAPA